MHIEWWQGWDELRLEQKTLNLKYVDKVLLVIKIREKICTKTFLSNAIHLCQATFIVNLF